MSINGDKKVKERFRELRAQWQVHVVSVGEGFLPQEMLWSCGGGVCNREHHQGSPYPIPFGSLS